MEHSDIFSFTGQNNVSNSLSNSVNWYNNGFMQNNSDKCKNYLFNSTPFKPSLLSSCNIPMIPTKVRKRPKRRGTSPKIFPYKVHVTEDKVAEDLWNLCISQKQKTFSTNFKPKRQRTFSEIEKSIQLESESDEEDGTRLKISDEFQKEINEFKRNLLQTKPTKSVIPKPSASNALVLWTPPSIVARPLVPKKLDSEIVNLNKQDCCEDILPNTTTIKTPDRSVNTMHDLADGIPNWNHSNLTSFPAEHFPSINSNQYVYNENGHEDMEL